MNISFCYKRAHLCLYPAKTEVQVVIPEFNIIEDQFGYYWLLDLQLPKTSALSLSLSLSFNHYIRTLYGLRNFGA